MFNRKHNTDLIAAIFTTIIGIVFWIQLEEVNSPMDVIFPKAVLISLFVLSGILFIKALNFPEMKKLFDIKNLGMVGIGALCLMAWVMLMNYTGFVPISILMFALLSWVMQEKQNRTLKAAISSLLVGAVLVGLVYLVFVKLLLVPLPKGSFF